MNATQLLAASTPIDFNPFDQGHPIEKIVSINQAQQEILLSCLIGSTDANLAYNESISIQLEGHFSIDHFNKAFMQLLTRHEALRSVISADGTRLVIYEQVDFSPLIDLSLSESADSEQEILVKQEMSIPFDLYEGPLFRVIIQKSSLTSHCVTLIFHHIICDGWSIGIILEDLSKIYNAYSNGNLTLLPHVVQLSQFADEQASYLKSNAFIKVKQFWLDQYQGGIPKVNFPTDFPRGTTRSYQSHRIDNVLDPNLVEQLRKTGAKCGSTLVNTMLSLFEIFIYKKTRQKDLIIGLPAAAQAATGNFNLVGHCVNILPLKSHVNPQKTLQEYLYKRKKEFLDCLDHQLYSFGQLLTEINIEREAGRIPLVPIVFNIDMGMDSDVHFEGLTHQITSNARLSETFEIFVNATNHSDGLVLEWNYNTQLFSEESIKNCILEFRELMQFFVMQPTITIQEAVFKNEKPAIIEGKTLQNDKSIVALLADAAALYKTAKAARFNDQILSYHDLAKHADALAFALMDLGSCPGKVVALATNRSLDMLIGLIAILKTGAAYLPVDPNLPQDRIDYMLRDSAAAILVHNGQVNDSTYQVTVMDMSSSAQPDFTGRTQILPQIDLESLAYIIYTSGSTGRPKGVKITHKNLANVLLSLTEMPGITPHDRFLALTTISFDIAAVEIFLPLISGAEVVIADDATQKDGRLLNQLISHAEISLLQATPSTLSMLLDSGFGYYPGLKVIAGGEALNHDLARKILASGAKLWNIYGPTETTIYSIGKQIYAEDLFIAIGKPIHNTCVEILDEDGQPLSVGAIGEICIGGDGVTKGYVNNPLQTKDQFIASTHPGGKALYKTGDLGKIHPNGEVECFGRIDHQIKIRGFRIEPGEIENALLTLPQVAKALVIQRSDIINDQCLVAYLVFHKQDDQLSSSPQPIEIDQIKLTLGKSLPNYMIPDFMVAIDAFPVTANSKVDRKSLPKPISSSPVTSLHTTSLTPIESELSEIWKRILGIAEVGIHDIFFELGGHSLLAVKVMVAVEQQYALRLPISTLLTHPTISKLSEKVSEGNLNQTSGVIIPIRTTGKKTPVFLIHGSGLNVVLFQSIIPYLDEDQPIYGIQALGLHHEEEIPPTIEDIAQRYIREMMDVQPSGAYNIVGYSLGGFIAFEIARQLKALGKEIKLLGVIDTDTGRNILPENIKPDLGYFLKRQIKKVPFIFKSFIKAPTDTLKYQLNITKNRFIQLVDRDFDLNEQPSTVYEQHIAEAYHVAYSRYLLRETDLKVSLFRVTERLYFLDDLKYLGWDRFAKQGVDIFEIPGDHKTFLSAPNHISFAQILQKALND